MSSAKTDLVVPQLPQRSRRIVRGGSRNPNLATASGSVSAASPVSHLRHLEIFTRATIEAILSVSGLGARLRWAARADVEPTATKGGDPSGTHKRWFGRVSGRDGWW